MLRMRLIWSSVGSGVLSIRFLARTTMPGVQKPHCKPPAAMKLSAKVSRSSSLKPSSVSTVFPATRFAVDDYRAASTLTLRAAAVLWRDQPAGVAQDFEKRHSVFNLDSSLGCV